MTAMDVKDVMSLLGDALGDIPGLNVYGFPPKSAQTPFAFVAMPERIDYDLTFGRGYDRFSIKIYLGVADVVDQAAQLALASYAGTSAPNSVKTAVEAHLSIGQHGVRVTAAEFGEVHLAGGSYAGVTFTVDCAA